MCHKQLNIHHYLLQEPLTSTVTLNLNNPCLELCSSLVMLVCGVLCFDSFTLLDNDAQLIFLLARNLRRRLCFPQQRHVMMAAVE